jgi:2-desacetyl-2-hydroxyethyl bacteriochlorophyllide A dehydrogenase
MIARAAVVIAPWRVRFQKVEVPEPGPEDVIVRVRHSWISNGTEGSFIRGERIAGDTPRRDSDPLPFPHVPGYQKVGVVERVGSAVEEVRPGDRVFASVSRVERMFYPTGGHVSPAVTHQSQVWKLPDGVNLVAASGLVLTQVGYNCGTRPTLSPGDAAIVIGDGLVGHWTAQTLAHRGARVLLAGRHAERLARFVPRKGDALVNILEEDLTGFSRAWAPEGVQVAVDTVGSVPAIEALYPALRRDAHLVSAGFYGPRGHIDIQPMRALELTLHTPAGWTRDRMSRTLELLAAGALQAEPLITHRFPAERAAEAYELVLKRPEPVLGVVLNWEGGDA